MSEFDPRGGGPAIFKNVWNSKKVRNKLGLSWAKLKFSLDRVVDEVTVIFNSVEVEIEVTVELSLLFLVGEWVGGGEKNEINAILNSVVV